MCLNHNLGSHSYVYLLYLLYVFQGIFPVKYEFFSEDPKNSKQTKIGCIFTKLRLCDLNGCG